jgi:hypothetical protein
MAYYSLATITHVCCPNRVVFLVLLQVALSCGPATQALARAATPELDCRLVFPQLSFYIHWTSIELLY